MIQINKASIEKVKEVRQGLTKLFENLCKVYGTDDVILELMQLRGYTSTNMLNTLKEVGVFKISYLSELTLIDKTSNEVLNAYGLLTENGDYLLKDRYVVPIRDIGGMVTALVGWHPMGGSRKYVTTPTLGFNRDAQFFNMDSYALSMGKFNGDIYVVEGIFDTLAMRSLGLPCYGNMGLEMGILKSEILTRHSKVIAIPDNDNAGKSVTPMLNLASGKSRKFIWSIPQKGVFVQLPKGVKDPDTFIRDFDCLEDLINCRESSILKKLYEE